MLNCFPLPGHFHEGAAVLAQPTTLRRHLSGFRTGARPAYEAVEEHLGLPADDDLVLLLETTFPELLYEACWCLLAALGPCGKATHAAPHPPLRRWSGHAQGGAPGTR